MRRKLAKQRHYEARQVGRVISRIGKKAGVIVH